MNITKSFSDGNRTYKDKSAISNNPSINILHPIFNTKNRETNQSKILLEAVVMMKTQNLYGSNLSQFSLNKTIIGSPVMLYLVSLNNK